MMYISALLYQTQNAPVLRHMCTYLLLCGMHNDDMVLYKVYIIVVLGWYGLEIYTNHLLTAE